MNRRVITLAILVFGWPGPGGPGSVLAGDPAPDLAGAMLAYQEAKADGPKAQAAYQLYKLLRAADPQARDSARAYLVESFALGLDSLDDLAQRASSDPLAGQDLVWLIQNHPRWTAAHWEALAAHADAQVRAAAEAARRGPAEAPETRRAPPAEAVAELSAAAARGDLDAWERLIAMRERARNHLRASLDKTLAEALQARPGNEQALAGLAAQQTSPEKDLGGLARWMAHHYGQRKDDPSAALWLELLAVADAPHPKLAGAGRAGLRDAFAAAAKPALVDDEPRAPWEPEPPPPLSPAAAALAGITQAMARQVAAGDMEARMMLKVLYESGSPATQAEVVQALTRHAAGDPILVHIALFAARSPEPSVRLAAVDALAAVAPLDYDAASFLRALTDDRDSDVRKKAKAALRELSRR